MSTIYEPPWPAEAQGHPEWWDANVEGHQVTLTYTGGQVDGVATEVSASGIIVRDITVKGEAVPWSRIRSILVGARVRPERGHQVSTLHRTGTGTKDDIMAELAGRRTEELDSAQHARTKLSAAEHRGVATGLQIAIHLLRD